MGRRGADLPVCGTLPILRRRDIVPNSQPPPITLLIPTPEQADARRQGLGARSFCPRLPEAGIHMDAGTHPARAGISVISDPGDRTDGRFHLFFCALRIQEIYDYVTISFTL